MLLLDNTIEGSDFSRVGFLRRGVIAACLKQAGKQPSLKERFASSAINSAKTAAHDLTKMAVAKMKCTYFTAVCLMKDNL